MIGAIAQPAVGPSLVTGRMVLSAWSFSPLERKLRKAEHDQ